MLSDYLLIVPLFAAVGAGWWLGRSQILNRQAAETSTADLSREYFTGLDHLINENTEEAIESFIRALEINSDTIPAHLTLAKLFRRKGEVDRAVGIHQKLLARPDLLPADSLRIQMALARDYDALGLLDRAENLLQDIILRAVDGEARRKALLLLVKLYEKEREWQQALDTARQLQAADRVEIESELAHYCCERAEVVLREGDSASAEKYLRQALVYDSGCCRASLIRARMQMAQGRWRAAIKALKQVLEHHLIWRTLIAAQRYRLAGQAEGQGFQGFGDLVWLIRRHWQESDFTLSGRFPWLIEAQGMLKKGQSAELEQHLLAWFWQQLRELEQEQPFSFTAVAAYRLRWSLAEYRLRWQPEQAQEEFDRLVVRALAGFKQDDRLHSVTEAG